MRELSSNLLLTLFPCATYDSPLLRLVPGEQPVFGLFWIMLKTCVMVVLFALPQINNIFT